MKKVYQITRELSETKLNRRKRLVMVLMDVRNAFNSASRTVIGESLKKRNISNYLRKIIDSYPSNEVLRIKTEDDTG